MLLDLQLLLLLLGFPELPLLFEFSNRSRALALLRSVLPRLPILSMGLCLRLASDLFDSSLIALAWCDLRTLASGKPGEEHVSIN